MRYFPNTKTALMAVFALALAACGGGDTSSSSPSSQPTYTVDTLEELQSIATGFKNEALDDPLSLKDSLDAHYVLTANIDASDTAIWNDAGTDTSVYEGFLPIGNCGTNGDCLETDANDNNPFSGSFDGDGYTISGLHIDRPITNYVGLFGFADGALLRNIALEGGSVTGNDRVGGLVGWNYFGAIESSYATGTVTGNRLVGGLVGDEGYFFLRPSRIRDSFATGTVTGDSWVGGLVGSNSSSPIESSFATGSVTGNRLVGGLVGVNGGTIESSFATGSVTSGSWVGGLVGSNHHDTIESSFATGSVTGDRYVGGLIGSNSRGTIESSFATGSVTGDRYVGGLIGSNDEGTIQDAYAFGQVSCSDTDCAVGGLVGINYGEFDSETIFSGTLRRAYYNSDVYASDPGAVGDNTNIDGGGSATGVIDTATVLSRTEAQLKALTCSSSVFGSCDAWDFSSNSKLPVIKGLIAVLDADGQRALLNFDASSLDKAGVFPGVAITLDASGLIETGNELTYHWSIPPAIIDAVFADDGSSVTFTVSNAAQEIGLTIIERDANGNIVRIYSDTIAVVSQDGTADAPWRVNSLEELQSIATGFKNEALDASLSLEDSLAAHYVLTANIDASDTASGNWMQSVDDRDTPDDASDDVTLHGFLPIGNCGADNICFSSASDDEPFTGSFDGKGHTIDGLHIDRPTTDHVGLFGFTNGAVLRNIALEGGSVTGAGSVGGLVGSNNGTMQNSFATGSVTGAGSVGGLVGQNFGTIRDSFATGSVTGAGSVGGLVGGSNGTIESSSATGSVTGDDKVGGLVGSNNGTMQNSFAIGSVGGDDNVGGLVGQNFGTIRDSFATGSVTGAGSVGGLVGDNDRGTIESSFATGSVTGASSVGGLVGDNDRGTIESSSATGSVSGSSSVGGLIGVNGGTIVSSSATGSVTGAGSVGGLIGSNNGTMQNSFATGSVTGAGSVGGLVGSNNGTIVSSSATGSVTGASSVGGLVGSNGGTIESSFATGSVTSGSWVGGLVGSNGGTIESSFATGSVTGASSVGGLVGGSNGTIESSFATGSVTGASSVGGLVGFNPRGTIQDAYAFGQVSCSDTDCAVGGLVGINYGEFDSETIFSGTLRRAYYNSDVYASDPGAVGDNTNIDGGGSATGVIEDALAITEDQLKALACDATTVFRWDDDVTTATDPIDCAAAGAANFPWDFGSSSELPVLNGSIGGVLDAARQRALINFDASSLDKAGVFPGEATILDASSLVSASAGNTLEYHWSIPPDITDAVFALDGSTVSFTIPGGARDIWLTIIEHDTDGKIVGVYSDGVAIMPYGGTSESPFEVGSLEELQSIATGFKNDALDDPLSLEDSLTAHYILTVNIDASGTASGNWMQSVDDNDTPDNDSDDVTQHGFLPIGNSSVPFSGSFDGKGYTISGLYIGRSSTDYVGLFGVIDGAMLRDVALEGGSVSGDDNVGGLIGLNRGLVQDSFATGSVSGDDNVGGLIGSNDEGTIESSFATGSVSGDDNVGGLIGSNDRGTIRDSYATGNVSGDYWVGGLIGSNDRGTIQDSFATGSVSGAGYVGGLVGDGGGTIQDSFATGSVSGDDNVGGLVGDNFFGTIESSFATGSVSGDGRVGGLIGSNDRGTIRDSYATGNVSGDGRVGGLIGYNGGTIQDSYALGQASCSDEDCTLGGLVGINYWGSTSGTPYPGILRRAYYNSDVYGSDPNAVGDNTNTDDGGSTTGVIEDALAITEDQLKALACDATTVFRWDDDVTTATDPIDCAAAGAVNFPWDFGISTGDASTHELPVLNGTTGLVGGLDVAGQRDLIEFALVDRTANGSASTLAAPSITKLDAAHTLSYSWEVVSGSVSITSGDYASAVGINGATDGDVLSITIIERNVDGAIVRVYGDTILLVVE